MEQNPRSAASSIYLRMRFDAQFNTSSSASTFYVVGAFTSNISRQFYAAACSLIFSHCNLVRLPFISSFHQCIALIIPVLATFLQLKYQGINDETNKTSTPFSTHSRTMLLAVSSTVVYYLAYMALLRFPLRRFAHVIAHHCLVWSAYASVASLTSVLFPDSFSPFVYAIFVLLSVDDLMCCLYHKLVVEEGADFRVYRRRFRRFLNNICRVVVGNFSGQWPQILPI